MLRKLMNNDLLRGICVALWVLGFSWPIDTYLRYTDVKQGERT